MTQANAAATHALVQSMKDMVAVRLLPKIEAHDGATFDFLHPDEETGALIAVFTFAANQYAVDLPYVDIALKHMSPKEIAGDLAAKVERFLAVMNDVGLADKKPARVRASVGTLTTGLPSSGDNFRTLDRTAEETTRFLEAMRPYTSTPGADDEAEDPDACQCPICTGEAEDDPDLLSFALTVERMDRTSKSDILTAGHTLLAGLAEATGHSYSEVASMALVIAAACARHTDGDKPSRARANALMQALASAVFAEERSPYMKTAPVPDHRQGDASDDTTGTATHQGSPYKH